jgi:hypothetical protein
MFIRYAMISVETGRQTAGHDALDLRIIGTVTFLYHATMSTNWILLLPLFIRGFFREIDILVYICKFDVFRSKEREDARLPTRANAPEQ